MILFITIDFLKGRLKNLSSCYDNIVDYPIITNPLPEHTNKALVILRNSESVFHTDLYSILNYSEAFLMFVTVSNKSNLRYS